MAADDRDMERRRSSDASAPPLVWMSRGVFWADRGSSAWPPVSSDARAPYVTWFVRGGGMLGTLCTQSCASARGSTTRSVSSR